MYLKNIIFIHINNCFSSVFHREEEPSPCEMMARILDHICLTSELPHIVLRFNQKKQVGKLIMKTTSAGRFFKDTSRIPTVQRIHLLFHLEVGWPNWGSEYGEISNSFGKCVTFVKTCFLCVLLMYYIFQFLSILFASVYVIGFS